MCYQNKDALSAGIIVAGWDKEVGPSVYNIPLGGGMFRQPWAIGGELTCCVFISFKGIELLSGSGSTYVYGYCDATYQEGWNREQTVEFVRNSMWSTTILMSTFAHRSSNNSALSLAMSRDGSSGGVIRMCVITEDGAERLFVPGDKLPKFWEGREVLPAVSSGKPAVVADSGIVPMAVEA